MRLTLLSAEEYANITLPEKVAGHYWLKGKNAIGKPSNIVSIDSQENEDAQPNWVLKSNQNYKVKLPEGKIVQQVDLEAGKIYLIVDGADRPSFALFTEPSGDGYRQFTPYRRIRKYAHLTIGRDPSCDICYQSGFVTTVHAELVLNDDKASIQDKNSRNRTYLNGSAIEQAELKNGDVIYVMGLQIIVTSQFLFINHPSGNLLIQTDALQEYHPPRPMLQYPEQDEEKTEEEDDYFYRAPRFKFDANHDEMKLDAPPANQNADDTPMVMLVGPSMTMGMASVATGTYAIASAASRGDLTSAIPSVVMCCSMLLGTIMWPLITKNYQRRRKVEREALRQKSYRKYLEEMERQVAEETRREEDILRNNDVSPQDYMKRILAPTPQIWERTRKHSDFLSLRLGLGALPLNMDIRYSERRFTLDEDNLLEDMYRFGEQKRLLHDVPVCLSLTERRVSGVYGSREELLRFAQSMILQLTALHAYDEVRLVMLYRESDEPWFSFTRWLPHTMEPEGNIRWIARRFDEAKELSAVLDPVIEYRKNLSDEQLEDESPYYVVICTDKELAMRTECVRRILGCKDNLAISVVCFFERLKDLPKECSAVVDLDGTLTLIDDVCEPALPFRVDDTTSLDTEAATAVLANTEIDIKKSNYVLPKQYTFLEMMNVGMVEHLNLSERWKTNDPTRSLAACVGVDRYGALFPLDLHEKAHGPHGLVAGMTGSGKSEFLITYLLSMALNFHPYEVAFILIDYKGGGMAKALENLPHTAGVITNLDGNGIKRSLSSMRSELHRRERIFAETAERHGISNIDIYKYQRLYRERKASEPLPHLLIVSDEFAELKKDQPEFMSELTSTARVGRALGVHLILATQKPGGIVDEQIQSNSRFRVCLKVQDNGDSMEMLGRSEAAHLVDTGRFYLQVGNNELFELGQSAWAGAPYYPSQRPIVNRDDGVAIISTVGRVLAETNINRFASIENPSKQLDVLTRYISKVGAEEGVTRWKMWLDRISDSIVLSDLEKKYPPQKQSFVLAPLVGEYDEPAHQLQGPLRLPISEDGNVIVYGSAGSGKSMLVEAMCYSLLHDHSPEEVNLYLLDFEMELLTAFSEAPHVGDVILAHETEKVQNLFKVLTETMERRKKLLASFGGDLLRYNQSTKNPQPNILVVIHNYAIFSEVYEYLSGDMTYLCREGRKYGIFFVLTCAGVNHVRLNLRQYFRCLYCLQMNNTDEYSTVVGKTDGLFPEKNRGRGIFRRDKDNLLEFQTAHITSETVPYDEIRRFCGELATCRSGNRAARVPVLPELVDEAFLRPYCTVGSLDSVPVGVKKVNLDIAYYPLADCPVTLALSTEREWEPFTDALARIAAHCCRVKTLVLAPESNWKRAEEEPLLRVATDLNGCATLVKEIYEIIKYRNNSYKDALDAGERPPEFEPILVVLRSAAQVKALLERYVIPDEEKQADDDTLLNRLWLVMQKCDKAYRVSFLVADSVSGLTPFTATDWYRTHVNGTRGIWIGNGINNQFRLSVIKKPQGFTATLQENFGFMVQNSSAEMVKFLR